MAIRLDIELTSARPDGDWTWRKAGAKLPKGELSGALLPSGASVGDVVRVEAEQALDGIEITQVLPAKAARKDRHERIEVVGTNRGPTELVTTTLVKGRRNDRDRDRGDRPRGDGRGRDPRRDGGRPGRPDGRADGGARDRARRGESADRPQRPRPKRLRPGRAHRSEVLGALPPEHQPIAEQVLQGGVPAVRQAIARQNTSNREQGLPEITGDELVALAEKLLPQLRAAEWRDRADAALEVIEELDLRDLRSVVVAADAASRDDESRALVNRLREALSRRVEAEHAEWLRELEATLAEGRVVRALRLSSRPPKAGVPLPPEVGTKLKEQAVAALSSDAFADRWATVLDALAFSPVRASVIPAGIPSPLTDEFKAKVAPFVGRVPQIAELLGIDPATAPKPPRRHSGGDARGSKDREARRPTEGRGPRPTPRPGPAAEAPLAEPVAEPVVETVAEPVADRVEPSSALADESQDIGGVDEPEA